MQTLLRITYSFVFSCLLVVTTIAQMHNGQYGNEWIDHNQSYYKIKITEDGFYSIDKQVLQNNIVDFQQIIPQQIQLFHEGQEVPVYVDVVNGQVESISFYAERNKGALDASLYRKAHNQLNPEYSLYNDEATYFLTWDIYGNTNQYQDYASSFNNMPDKESFFIYESKSTISNQWNQGLYINYGGYILSNGTFDFGEGYASSFSNSRSVDVATPALSTAGPTPELTIRAYASGYANHSLQVSVGGYTQQYDTYYGDSVFQITEAISHSDISNSTTSIQLNGLMGTGDKYAVSVVSVKYPRVFDFEGNSIFKFDIASGVRKYLEIDNFNGGDVTDQNVYLYDMTNQLRIHCHWDGSKVRVELPASSTSRSLVLVNETAKSTVYGLYDTDFVNYSMTQGDYIILSHPDLFNDSEGNNPVFDYAVYRAQTGYNPVIVDVNRLYDQFAYGVQGHPIAIKNFAAYINKNWQNMRPEHIFIIGKGRLYKDIRNAVVTDNLVPTFGYPASDNLLLAPIASDVPVLPVGRLAATTGDQVSDYLKKIITLESAAKDSISLEAQGWRKKTLHLGGGANSWEHSVLKSHLINMQPIIENGNFGAQVYSFFKEQDEHVSVPNTQRINSLINDGVSMITFYGHGSTKGFDFYLDSPERYKNKDRYPLIMALGCYNGTIYEGEKLISERFIFEQQSGAIGYLGFVNAVSISAASNISASFYNLINDELYGAGMGEVLKRTLEDFTASASYNYNPVFQMGAQYLVYHGDPALKLNYRTTADFHVDETTIRTYPEKITEDVRNFKLLVDVHNFGKNIDSAIVVKVVRRHPSGKIDTCTTTISTPRYKQTVEFMFEVNGYADFGANIFSVFVDANDVVTELPAQAEANNHVLNYNVVIGNPVVLPVFPKKFAIVSDSLMTFKAMATNAFERMYTWEFEVDTTESFDSPLLVQTALVSGSSLAEWNPGISFDNNQVYYWRVKAIDVDQQESDWSYASFLYEPTAVGQGWNQSDFFQFQKNNFDNLLLDNNQSNMFEFTPSLYEISAKSGYIGHGVDDENLAIYQNGSKVDKCRCSGENGVYVAVMDPSTLNFWTMPGGSTEYGAVNCDIANRTAYAFLFKNVSYKSQLSLERFVMDSIPNGHMVVMYTLNNGYGQRWSEDFVSFLKEQGSEKIDSFVYTEVERSFAIAFKKGTANYPYFSEEVGMDKDAVAAAYTATEKAWDRGTMTSPLIGPAQSWSSVEWSVSQIETPGHDIVSIDVWGIDQYGEKQLLFDRTTATALDLTTISAQQYPYIQLRLNNKDEWNATPAQLDYWRVFGEMNVDGALTIEDDYSLEYDVATNQQNVVVDLAIWNMGEVLLDSSELEFIVLGSTDTVNHEVPTMIAADSMNVQINIPMIGLIGQQVIIAKLKAQNSEATLSNNWGWVEVNIPSNTQNNIAFNQKEASQVEVIDKLSNFPNPFSIETNIQFRLNDNILGELPDEVSIELYDTKGSLIRRTIQEAAVINEWSWNGQNQENISMPSGIYFCRVQPIYNTQDDLKDSQAEQKVVKIILAR